MKYLFISLLFIAAVNAQYEGRLNSISLNGVFTTSAKIYTNPFSSDETIRNNYVYVDGFYNASIDIRRKITDDLFVGVNVDYINTTRKGSYITAFAGNNTIALEVDEGFRLIPVELSIYYYMPFSTSSFKMLMGGGAGIYFGRHLRNISDVNEEVVASKAAFGIQANVTLDYMVTPLLGLRGEMKFRDPQFTSKGKYSKENLTIGTNEIRLPTETFDSKVNIDGLVFMLGLVVNF